MKKPISGCIFMGKRYIQKSALSPGVYLELYRPFTVVATDSLPRGCLVVVIYL